jgi:hypothetical protein
MRWSRYGETTSEFSLSTLSNLPQWVTIIKSFALHNSAVTSGSGDGVGDTAAGRRNLLGLR